MGCKRSMSPGRTVWIRVWLAVGFFTTIGTARQVTGEVRIWVASGVEWTSSHPDVSVLCSGSRVVVRFLPQKRPFCVADTVRILVPPDLLPTNITLRFAALTVQPSVLQLRLRSRYSGETWRVNLNPPEAGREACYSVPLRHDVGWMGSSRREGKRFRDDVRSIDWLGLYIRRHGSVCEQLYAIEHLEVSGLVATADRDGDGMPDEWEIKHGLNPDDPADESIDEDGDRMSNFAEYRAGTDPCDPFSNFRVQIALTNLAGCGKTIVLRWPSVAGRQYAVWRADAMTGVFERAAGGLQATGWTNAFCDETAGNRERWFYRVGIEE
ncbi:MAG: hypothetical protein N2255_04430 [Kiritimatiellae bacterium]|nr:hypothetical protein [Kiritimatiellia bacterium]